VVGALLRLQRQAGNRAVAALLQRDDGPAAPTGSGAQPVFLCTKPILGSGIHGKGHAFFRIGGSGTGNPTYELEHDKSCPCAWQGHPRQNEPEDVNAADAQCVPAPRINSGCLDANWSSYPIGMYCAWGPNSNTYAGVMTRRCGGGSLRPPGDTPGFDDAPPSAGGSGPNPLLTATGICFDTNCDGCPSS
jgi:hypothetical protein